MTPWEANAAPSTCSAEKATGGPKEPGVLLGTALDIDNIILCPPVGRVRTRLPQLFSESFSETFTCTLCIYAVTFFFFHIDILSALTFYMQ